jgi:cytochrome b subunit of formate dehydrogenase
MHVGIIVVGVLIKKMRLTLLITFQDFRDVVSTVLYYFGINKKKPLFEKFDYRQKFEYLGVVLGGSVMILTGFALLYPIQFTQILPGQFIVAAKIMHSSEAFLAFGVIVLWHVYGSHFSPDVFPMDKSIFTGYMPKEDMKHHHYLEYKRLFPNETDDEHHDH